MKNSTNKTLLFQKILIAMKRQTPYFSLAAVRRALGEAGITLADETLREYMSEAMAN